MVWFCVPVVLEIWTKRSCFNPCFMLLCYLNFQETQKFERAFLGEKFLLEEKGAWVILACFVGLWCCFRIAQPVIVQASRRCARSSNPFPHITFRILRILPISTRAPVQKSLEKLTSWQSVLYGTFWSSVMPHSPSLELGKLVRMSND